MLNIFKQSAIKKSVTSRLCLNNRSVKLCPRRLSTKCEVDCPSLENDCISSAYSTGKLERELCHNYQGVLLDCNLYLQFPSTTVFELSQCLPWMCTLSKQAPHM